MSEEEKLTDLQKGISEDALKSVGAEIKKFKHLADEVKSINKRLNEIRKKHKVEIALFRNKDRSARLVIAIDRENSIP